MIDPSRYEIMFSIDMNSSSLFQIEIPQFSHHRNERFFSKMKCVNWNLEYAV